MNEKKRTCKMVEGSLEGSGLRFAIVVSRFNHFIVDRLLEGCLDTLSRHGVDLDGCTVVKAPGSFEVPHVTKKVAATSNADAVIALGAVIRGDTPHFDFIAQEVTKGLAQLSLGQDKPITYGYITSDTIEQAVERAGTKAGNKGADAALAAIEMANLNKKL